MSKKFASQKLIVGNWKMNQSLIDIDLFFEQLIKNKDKIDCNFWIAPQYIHIPKLLSFKSYLPKLFCVGGQNASHKESGAFTGDISSKALKDIGCDFVIIGHSERRSFFRESDEIINVKIETALKNNLKVIFCVGETLQERDGDHTKDVIKNQIVKGLKGLSSKQLSEIIIAYEPVWAIGTGKNATVKEAEEVHRFIRNELTSSVGLNPDELIVLYGGSVNPENIDALLASPDIDGALVGGASLKINDFLKLCYASSTRTSSEKK